MNAPQSQYAIQVINQQSSSEVERLMVLREKELQKERESLSRYVIQGISEQSSEEIERLMIFREKELRAERDSLERNYKRAVSDKLKVENELNATCEELRRKAKQADTRYQFVAEELKIVELERENKLAKLMEELAKKDEELKKVKEEKETAIGEMNEKLANKDREVNQLLTERNNILEDLVARVHFLQETITKEYGVVAMHKRSDHCQETLVEDEKSYPKLSPAMESSIRKGSCDEVDYTVVGDNGGFEAETMQNPVIKTVDSENCAVVIESLLNRSKEHLEKATLDISSYNALGAESPLTRLEGEHPNGETVIAAQSSSHRAAGGCDVSNQEKTLPAAGEPSEDVPVANRPLPSLEIIEISDGEDEGPTKRGVLTFRASGSDHTLKRKRSTSDSDDSSSMEELRGSREVQDTAGSKKVKTWFDVFMEKELANGEKKM